MSEYERKLVPGVTTTNGLQVVKVDECIAYIESCGWKLKNRTRGHYTFVNPRSSVLPRVRFSLKELRETYAKGW